MRGVDSSDAYLLLLGPHYGHTFPETGQSATHDEWVRAQTLGMPRYVFKKVGVDLDEDQAVFAASLGDYATGRFYKEFEQPHDLFREVTAVVRELGTDGGDLEFSPLIDSVSVAWLEPTPGWGASKLFWKSTGRPGAIRSLAISVVTTARRSVTSRASHHTPSACRFPIGAAKSPIAPLAVTRRRSTSRSAAVAASTPLRCSPRVMTRSW